MKRFAAVLLLAGLVGALAGAEAVLSVTELQALAKQGNLDLQKARWTLAAAEKDTHWESELSASKVSVSGGYKAPGSTSGGESASPLSASASVSVPVIPQVSVGASVGYDRTPSVSASVSVSPFAASRTLYKEKAAYQTAALDLNYQTVKVASDIEAAAYSVLAAKANLDVATAQAALREQYWEMSQQAYDLGEMLFDDLETARKDVIDARQSALDATRSLLDARVSLYRLLGPAAEQPSVKDVTVDELLALIDARDAAIAAKSSSQAGSLTLRKAEISLESLKEQLKATPVYRPSLDLSGKLSYGADPSTPEGAETTYSLGGSASVSFSFSPSDIKTDDRADISQSIDQTAQEIQLELMALRLNSSILEQALAVSRQTLQTRQTELKQAQAAVVEAELLLDQGQRTTLEVESVRLSARSAEGRLFSAAAAVLAAQASILLSYAV